MIQQPTFSLPHEIAFIAILSSAQLLTQAGLGQVLAPLTIIGLDLNDTSPGILAWFAAGYSLTVGTFILPAGRAGDLLGHRRLFLSGFTWFAVWSIIAGLARFTHSASFFIFCRVMQGIGPAIMLPNALAILGRTYPTGARKNTVFAIFGSTAPIGAVLGALFASLLADRVHWDWAYYICGITSFSIVAATFIVVPKDAKSIVDGSEFIARMDAIPTIFGVTGLVLFNVAWNQAPIDGWQASHIITLLILSVLSIIAFAYIESRAPYPLLPKSLFTVEISLILACIAAGWAAFGTWIYYGWLFFEEIRGHSPLLATAMFSPVVVSGTIAAGLTALLIKPLGPSKLMVMSMFGFTLGNLLFSIAPINQTYWGLTFVAIFITPFGMDASFSAANLVISDFVPADVQGNAASLVNTILNYSVSLGLGIAGTVEVHVNNGGTTKEDILNGYRGAWRVGIGLGILGIALSLLLTYITRRSVGRIKQGD